MPHPEPTDPSDPSEYCREVETYLCRKNEGHLIRIAGPAFEQVCGWAAQGVPLKVAFRGIDRYCERYYAKGPRRRPVRIEFCEADILDVFDEWRRAVGVTLDAGGNTATEEPAHRKASLASHIERAIARLTSGRAGGRRSAAFDTAVGERVRDLDRLLPEAKTARGEARAGILASLEAIDRELLQAARGEVSEARARELRTDADLELAPFAGRMSAEARARASDAAYDRLLREEFGLPPIEYDR